MRAAGEEAFPRRFARRIVLALAIWGAFSPAGQGQTDRDVTTARAWIGRALFLRGFYGANDLKFDEAGKVVGKPRVVDWTVAGFDLQAVERKGADGIELDGVRVAIRYNPDNRFFERHPQKEEHVKITVTVTGRDEIEKTLGAIFAVGIDPAMQRSMPGYWMHYFQPGAAWQEDEGTGKIALPVDLVAGAPQDVTVAVPEKKVEPKYPSLAERDKVQGTVQMLVVVDELGLPRHVAIARPLGYGMDAEAAEAVARWKWRPALRDGKAVAARVGVGQEFRLVAVPGR